MKSISREEILLSAKKENVSYIRLQFTDMLGTIKSVEVPVSRIKEVLDGKVMFDGSSIEGFVRIMEADMYLHPDYHTWIVLPFENLNGTRTARLICDVYLPTGEPFKGDPRYVLKQEIEKMHEMGIENFNMGVEPEFYLLKEDEKGNATLDFSDSASYFDMGSIDQDFECRHDIVLELEKYGFSVEASHHEVGPGQNEVDFRYSNVLDCCDNIQTFKQVVHEVARKHHLVATFMPKPVAFKAGNGMHVNCSLSDKEGNNLFYDPSQPFQLSMLCRKWINGILKNSRGISAITNPIVNSYKRIVPGYEAPCYICWSDANRSSMIRIPEKRGEGTRTEIRNVDPAANPYLMAACVLGSGLDGIKKDEPLIDAVYDNIFELTREQREAQGIDNLPENLKDAVKEFKKSTLAKEVLGEHIFNKYIEAKSLEWDQYRVLVSDWEVAKYLKL
ncbi:MAG: type I glutamate--ammonia ligase [Bacilli bacterium]